MKTQEFSQRSFKKGQKFPICIPPFTKYSAAATACTLRIGGEKGKVKERGEKTMRDTAIKILGIIIVMDILIILTIAFYSFINSLNIPDWMKYALMK